MIWPIHTVHSIIAFVRKHYIPEGGQNISTAKCDTNLRMTPFMYIYILGGFIILI